MDLDKDGIVSKDEFFRMCKMKNSDKFTDDRIEKLWKKTLSIADEDHDGQMTWDEFILSIIKQGNLKPV